MNYQKIHDKLIEKAKISNRVKPKKIDFNYVYYEKHHIIPRCMGGSNDIDNLVLLTAREHFIIHKLLTYIYKGNRKIACAFHRMTYNKQGKLIISGRDYLYARELICSIPRSKETCKKISESLKGIDHSGEKNSMFGKHHSFESKKIIGLKSSQKIITEETKIKHSLATKGEKNGMFGKYHTEESNKRNSEKHKGVYVSLETKMKHRKQDKCIYCGFECNISNLHRYHNENCKKINILI